jgi:hypothetical protein
MSKPFDLAAAQRGEPVEVLYNGADVVNKPDNFQAHPAGWLPASFIGSLSDGKVLVEDSKGCVHFATDEFLRMTPKKVTVRYRNYKCLAGAKLLVGVVNESEPWPYQLEKMTWFNGWIHTEWQTVEVPQGDNQ